MLVLHQVRAAGVLHAYEQVSALGWKMSTKSFMRLRRLLLPLAAVTLFGLTTFAFRLVHSSLGPEYVQSHGGLVVACYFAGHAYWHPGIMVVNRGPGGQFRGSGRFGRGPSGPNGSGKSTLIRRMLELDAGDGHTALNGHIYSALPDPLRVVGAVLDAGALHPGLTVRAHLRVIARAVAGDRIEEVIEQVGLSGERRR